MKKIIYFFVITLLIGFVSCNKDEEEPIVEKENIEIEVKVFVKTKFSSDYMWDNGAKIYLYYGFYSGELMDFKIEENGKLVNGDSIIQPSQTAVIEKEGTVNIIPLFTDRKLTLLVESKYCKGLYSNMIYSHLPRSQKLICYFKESEVID